MRRLHSVGNWLFLVSYSPYIDETAAFVTDNGEPVSNLPVVELKGNRVSEVIGILDERYA
jgi:hypothetical protein